MNGVHVHRNERGFALVVSMLILLVMTLLGIVLMAGVNMNRTLAGNDQRMRKSLNIAEAGLGEAMARISNQDAQMDAADPDDVCQVFNTVAGSVPVLGADSTALATGQTAGSYMDYSTATRGPDVLTIAWKKNAAGTAVMRYDGMLNPAVNTASGLPIYVVTATGRVGQARRTVVTEVIQRPSNVFVKAALAADIPINFIGTANICGFNHRADTPSGDGNSGRGVMPGDADHCIDNETGASDLPGAWSTGAVTGAGASAASGSPSGWVDLQTGFYQGPWESLGLSQAEYWSWMGAPISAAPASWNGVNYWDGNGITQDRSTDLALHSLDAEGFLYVDGDLKVNAGFTYRGLIYVEGDFEINGSAWVLGGIIVSGETEIKANGTMTILYSSDAIAQALAKYGGQFVTLSWREE